MVNAGPETAVRFAKIKKHFLRVTLPLLVRRYSNKDICMQRSNFMKLFLEVECDLRAYLLAVCRDWHVADDLFQETSCVLWEKYEAYDESRPFIAWAMGIARLECLKWRQKQARSKECFSEAIISLLAETAAAGKPAENKLLPLLRQCIDKLNPQGRLVLSQRYEHGKPIEEIAALISKSVGAVKMLLKRTRMALRKCVEDKQRMEESGHGM
jgi:RNA polymerase sigma-70 factor (ECF subfamily)